MQKVEYLKKLYLVRKVDIYLDSLCLLKLQYKQCQLMLYSQNVYTYKYTLFISIFKLNCEPGKIYMNSQESQFDDEQKDYNSKSQYLHQKQGEDESEISSFQENRLAQLSRMYQKLLKNSKHFISKLCIMLSKFIPFDQNIKQSFNFIKTMQQEWRSFNNQQDEKSTIFERQFSYYPKTTEDIFKTKFEDYIRPNIKQLHEKKSQVSSHKKSFLITQTNQKRHQTQSIESMSSSLNLAVGQDLQKQVKSTQDSEYKIKLKDEFFHVRQFVIFWLYPRLEVEQEKILQKKTVLNCYIDWNRKVMRQLQITQTTKIQGQLTVQIKLKIPQAEPHFRFFKGIGFKDQYINEMNLTDCRPAKRKKGEELSVQENEELHPLEQIRMIARRLQKNDKITPYNEQKMHALDVALGLI